jgi:CRISP-associated protein Cas1
MQLHIDSYGAFLGLKDGRFAVKPKDADVHYFSPYAVSSILLNRAVRVSTDALLLAAELQIPVVFTDRSGRSKAQLWSGKFGSSSALRKKQLHYSMSREGLQLIATTLACKISRQKEMIQQLAQRPEVNKNKRFALNDCTQGLQTQLLKFETWKCPKRSFDQKAVAATFRGWEGIASRYYFQLWAYLLPQDYDFKGRVQQPAYDRVNALLNYAYGLLYPSVEMALIKAGLDPTLGILHTDRYNAPSFVFDMIEAYRPWADKIVLELALDNLPPLSDFEVTERNGLYLLKNSKHALLSKLHPFLDSIVPLNERSRKRKNHIDSDMKAIATIIRQHELP